MKQVRKIGNNSISESQFSVSDQPNDQSRFSSLFRKKRNHIVERLYTL